jgi:cellulose synthase/poly-beta-1,6-N-acetylglucosamine synthase-like glycosyltransferase
MSCAGWSENRVPAREANVALPFWTFWISLGLIGYCYFLYPLLVLLLARLFPRPVTKGAAAPRVTVVVPAYNEEEIIRRKIENTLGLDYPREKLDIVVISDGSTDGTVRIASEYATRGVAVIDFPERRGKVRALLDAEPRIHCDVIVFSDASGMLRPDSLREMIANFADPDVGCVCGYYRSPGLEEGGGHGELLYWDYEFSIKKAQSRRGTLLGATGAMYAVRRGLFVPPRPDTINDDFVIPSLVVLRGYRSVLEEKAVVDDYDPHMGNFKSRVRVSAGNWQQLFYLKGLLSPARPGLAWQFLSHKVIRMVIPILLILILVAALVLWPPVTAALLGLMALAAIPRRGPGSVRMLSQAVRKFTAGNAASLYGMAIFFTRRGSLSWK